MSLKPRRSPKLAIKRQCLEAEMESPTIKKVRACFVEAGKQLFSPIHECLTSLPSVIELVAVKASYYFVNSLTSKILSLQKPDYRPIPFSVLQVT